MIFKSMKLLLLKLEAALIAFGLGMYEYFKNNNRPW
jgi:hypothetical protein